ncbi:uncharacterized protein METZ01_LOCUS88292 [marine metagenome]|jgi:putative FmdB family regulatory protein|uniref:Putative regulatory protein FmdB zinc ribbon domain-containing protein n=1 Tax=marine metagenome TaxID=408172 RepID=A0A381V6P0_9ZZZZ|tara:strand:+ start:310 stop:564 length:255 start_codon:yes stop_codon:yes gene_type:complete
MPTYDYKCEKCGHEFERQLSIAKMNEPTEYPCPCGSCHGTIIKMLAAPAFGDTIKMGMRKPDDGFRDRLKEIKSSHAGSTMNIP